MVNVAGAKTRSAAFDKKAAHTFISFGPNDGNISNTAVGDPHFATIQNIRVSIEPSRGAHMTGIAAEVRLSQTKAADDLTLCHAWQPALFLFLGAKGPDG